MKALPTLAALALLTASASASVVVTAPTPTTSGSIEFTTDITFTVNTLILTPTLNVVFDEWVAVSDGAQNFAAIPDFIVTTGNPLNPPIFSSSLSDNQALTTIDITPNDGVLRLQILPVPLNPGNTITILAGIYSVDTAADFNPLASQTFNGNIFLADFDGARISDVVPEPSAAALSAAALALGLLRRRRK